jgi:hypothetical protein
MILYRIVAAWATRRRRPAAEWVTIITGLGYTIHYNDDGSMASYEPHEMGWTTERYLQPRTLWNRLALRLAWAIKGEMR